VFGLAVGALESDSYVVQTYASVAIDRLLLMKGPDSQPILGRTQLKAFLQPLVTNIFKVPSPPQS
jgi:exportin-2 (importin alpha re-exporter)